MTLFTKPLVLTPHSKMASQSENTVNSLISLAHYSLRCMSHLICGLTPSWLWPISRIGSPLLPFVALFPFVVSYPHHPSSPFHLEFLDVLLLSKITLLLYLNSPLVLSKVCLLDTLGHKRATRCTFLIAVIIWLLPMLPSMRTLPSSLLPRLLQLLPLHLLRLASLPWWSLPIPVLQFPLHSFSPLLLLLFPRFSPSHLLQILIPYPPTPRPPRHPRSFPQAPPNDLHLPIALCKGTHTCTRHPFLTLFPMIVFLHPFVSFPFW